MIFRMESADWVVAVKRPRSKLRTGSMMMHSLVWGHATMYCHEHVVGSNTGWTIGFICRYEWKWSVFLQIGELMC